MAVINSKAGICNLAIGHLGISTRVVSIDSPTTKEEKDCALYYDITRQALLEAYDWSFAKSRVSVSASSETPAFKWSYKSSELPSDLLRFNALHYSNGSIIVNTNRKMYELEGNRILTDLSAPYYISYTRNVEIVSEMSRLFVMLLSLSLAKQLYKTLGSSSSTLANVMQEYDKYEIKAVSVNNSQNPPIVVNSSNYVNQRAVSSYPSEVYS